MGRWNSYGNKDRDKIIAIIAVALIVILALAALGLSEQTKKTVALIKQPIVFDNSIQSSGDTGTGLFGSSLSLVVTIPNASDIMVVATGGNGNFAGTGVTDTQGNTFSHILTATNVNIGSNLDVYTTFPISTTSDTLTATWAGGVPDVVIIVGFYKNVEGIGRITSLSSAVSVTSLSMNINTTRSGSLVLGFTELNPNTNPGIVASPGFIQRSDQPPTSGAQEELDFEEANRTYTSNTVFPFNPSWTTGAGQALVGAIELTPIFHQGYDFPECLTLGDSCHFNFATKASGITNANQALHAGTTYCTGITTGKMVTTVTSSIEVIGMYSLESRNVTGQVFTVLIALSTTAPSTVFGSGVCGGGTSNSINLYTPVTSTTGTGFTATFAFVLSGQTANSYWGSISVTPKTTNVAIDNLGTNGQVATPGSTITIIQLA